LRGLKKDIENANDLIILRLYRLERSITQARGRSSHIVVSTGICLPVWFDTIADAKIENWNATNMNVGL
jgi:hypothetical protein